MVDDVLVDGRGRGDEDGDAHRLPAAGAADLLPGRGDGAGIAGEDGGVQPADVDAELQRVGADDAEHLAVAQAPLDGPPLRGQVAAAIAAHPRPRAAAFAERLADRREQQLDGRPRPPEDDGLAAGPQERQRPALGEREGRAARAGRRIEQWRIDEEEVPLAGRRAVAVDEPGRPPGERPGQLRRVADGGRAAHDDRVRAVVGAQPEEPPQDVRDVAAEHAAVGVQLVDDDDPELLEQLEPLRVVGRIAEWSMSGLVTTTWPALRMADRIGAGVSPSYVEAFTVRPAAADSSPNSATWSCPSALVGKRNRARAAGSSAIAWSVGIA